ncbi:MAG TPA: hypothetical protein V6C89_21830 [Drouetiella sp.]
MPAPDWLPISLEFIESSVEMLFDEELTDRKARFAMVELTAGVELLLKGRLAQDFWPLVFADPGSADADKYESGNFVSANWDQVITRLQNASKLTLGTGERNALDKLRNARNKLMHQGAMDDKRAFKAKCWKALVVVLKFIQDEFGTNSVVAPQIQSLRLRVVELEEFVDKLFIESAERILQAKRDDLTIVNCPTCHRPAMFIQKMHLTCLCCHYSTDDLGEGLDENCENTPPSLLDDEAMYVGGEIVEGCCNDLVLRLEASDRKGIEMGQEEICFACGKRGDSLQPWQDWGPED